ncbi:hypothetical protein [Falsirhodobacter xinxiangensis]|uniref:hypothetical protein n=1 Tax=Falsirhodobacter xinxiangensis TaxID=2530049 RepID=UPI0010AA25F1|nr:hypothetical protein [Rhodobacter xinxiangensis]
MTTTTTPATSFTRTKATIRRDKIETHPDFITRQGEVDPFHLRGITRAIAEGETLPRLLVWKDPNGDPEGPLFLIEGHYRLWGHDDAGVARIPVEVISCPRKEAMILASEDGRKDRKNLTPTEKTDRAWRLVCDDRDTFSRTDIMRATGASRSTVRRMRLRRKEMREREMEPTGYWWRDMKDTDEDGQRPEGEMTEAQRRKIVKALTPAIRDILDWRKWVPAIPDDEAQFTAIADALGPQRCMEMLMFALGGDADEADRRLAEARAGNAMDDDTSEDDHEPNF